MHCFRYGDRGVLAETIPGLRRLSSVSLLSSNGFVAPRRFIERPARLLLTGSFRLKDSVTIGGICPVLKHGPRSLTCARVCELQVHGRNESDRYDPQGAVMTDLDPR